MNKIISSKQELTVRIARTIKSIRSHPVITDKLINAICRKNNVSVKVILTIAKGRDSKITPFKTNEDE